MLEQLHQTRDRHGQVLWSESDLVLIAHVQTGWDPTVPGGKRTGGQCELNPVLAPPSELWGPTGQYFGPYIIFVLHKRYGRSIEL